MRPTAHQFDAPALRRVFRRRPEILAAYLYGSHAKGRAGRHSDVDIGILLQERRGRPEIRIPPTYEVDVAGEIAGTVGDERVEVVILNSAPPLLAYEATRHGHRLFARRSRPVMRFELRTRQRYLDTVSLRAIQDHYLDRIIRRGFSKALAR